jgi:peroxiredoxin
MIALWTVVIVEAWFLVLLARKVGELPTEIFSSLNQNRNHAPDLGGLEIGETAPSFVAPDLQGQEMNLADFRGSRCMLAFVSAGCKSCDGTARALQSLHNDHPSVAIVFVGTSLVERNREYSAKHEPLYLS